MYSVGIIAHAFSRAQSTNSDAQGAGQQASSVQDHIITSSISQISQSSMSFTEMQRLNWKEKRQEQTQKKKKIKM